jgi:predicted ABC-type ATPase
MFAGPNGSGKSTMKSLIRREMLGVYLNPDELEREIEQYDFLDVESFGVRTTSQEILSFFHASALLAKADLLDEVEQLRFNDGKLSFLAVGVNAYFASVAADFLRQKLIETGRSFTFETVMSAPDKVSLLQKAQARGYRTYLYYVATDDPAINIGRVRHRVAMGGHAVPEDKIVSRYHRSLQLLMDAIRHTNRAYIFDNSTHRLLWLAEITGGKSLEMKTDQMPAWFTKAVWDKFPAPSE